MNEQNQIMRYCQTYRARAINITQEDVIVELIGKPDKIDSFIKLTKNLGIREIARTGLTAMSRGYDNFEEI